jgi:molybdopterin molybdotransferase
MSLSFEEARDLIVSSIEPLSGERVSLIEAGGRVLLESVSAPWDLPPWDNSAMDGFAVRSTDCADISPLIVSGYTPAGGASASALEPGCAVRIMTGAPIPPGCDAVIPFENADETDGRIIPRGPVRAKDHIRYRGEDVVAGTIVLPEGTVLRPAEINMLATFSRSFVTVHRRPRIAILSTGDELVELGDPLTPGRIINSNALSLAVSVRELGAEPILLGIARDEPESLREKLAAGLSADVLITSAGVSAGDRDFVREVLTQMGVRPVFWKVDIKPGRPMAFGLREKLPVFSLPGNPVSTMITFEEFVRPAILKMMGHRRVLRPLFRAELSEPVKKKPGRVQFLRMRITRRGERLIAVSPGDQNTGIVRTMVHANAIAILPSDCGGLKGGDFVDVHLLPWMESIEEAGAGQTTE